MANNDLTYTDFVYIIKLINRHGFRIWHDGVVIENEKADKEGRKKRMSAMCVKVREQTNMNRKEFAEWLGIPYRTMQDWERGVSEVPDYVLNLIAYKVKNEKEKGNI